MTQTINNHTNDQCTIKNFTKERYIDRPHFQKEWARVWSETWLLAGFEQDIKNPGDYFVFDIGPESILVTRTDDGAVQAFYNVCQHRGNKLVQQERGHADSFRCAYHAWTYNGDGSIRSIPDRQKFSLGLPCETLSLKKVHSDVWDGFVFISMADNPQPLTEFLGPVVEALAPYRFHKMVITEDQTVHHNCNWKTIIDNFSELYHVDYIHPQHQRFVDCCNDTVELFPNGHTGLAVQGATVNPRYPVPEEPTDLLTEQLKGLGLDPAEFRGRVPEIRRTVQVRKREAGESMGFDYSLFSDEQLSDVWQYNLFPNVILSFAPEYCWILRPRPHPTDPEKCYFDKITLTLLPDPALVEEAETKEAGEPGSKLLGTKVIPSDTNDHVRPDRDVFGHDAILNGEKTMTITIDQDIHLLGGVQSGMRSKGFNQVWLNDDEMRIQHFHNALDELMSD